MAVARNLEKNDKFQTEAKVILLPVFQLSWLSQLYLESSCFPLLLMACSLVVRETLCSPLA